MKRKDISGLIILSAFGVVCLHTNTFWNFEPQKQWVLAAVIESAFYFSVPIFYMVSAITLIHYRDRMSTGEYIVRRIRRILIPYAVFLILSVLYHNLIIAPSPLPDAAGWISCFFYPPDYSYYWFFIGLFALYAAIIPLSTVPEEKQTDIFGGIFLFLYLNISFFPSFFSSLLNMAWPYQLPAGVFGPVMYGLLGIFLQNLEIKKSNLIMIIIGILLMAASCTATIYSSLKSGALTEIGRGYYELNCIFYSTAIFLLAGSFFKRIQLPSWFYQLQADTFGIYLLQNFIISWIFVFHYGWIHRAWMRAFTAAGVFITCLFLTRILKKIPVIKQLF